MGSAVPASRIAGDALPHEGGTDNLPTEPASPRPAETPESDEPTRVDDPSPAAGPLPATEDALDAVVGGVESAEINGFQAAATGGAKVSMAPEASKFNPSERI